MKREGGRGKKRRTRKRKKMTLEETDKEEQ
jgi:hypothetical protein